uniref:Uncharacterized protein n=1 Tax=Anguilla anguilla TaxID=7936 RepID=A0A0E9XH78_ANGAN
MAAIHHRGVVAPDVSFSRSLQFTFRL